MGEDTSISRSHLASLIGYVERHASAELVIVSTLDLSHAYDKFNTRIKKIEDNQTGVYSAMNIGVEAAEGEYIYFSNVGDDFLGVDIRDLEYDLECFPVAVLSETGIPKFIRFPDHKFRIMPPHQGMFAKREILYKEKFDTSLRFCADLKWYLAFKGKKRFHKFPVVANFRLGGISNQGRYFLKRKRERYQVILKHVLDLL